MCEYIVRDMLVFACYDGSTAFLIRDENVVTILTYVRLKPMALIQIAVRL